MLKALLLTTLILTIIFNQYHSKGFELSPERQLEEKLNIYQIFNETIFELNISYTNDTDILKLGNELSRLNNYTIIVANLNMTERSLRWFFSEYNPMNRFPFLIEKGAVFAFSYNETANVNKNNIISSIEDFFKAKFIIVNETSTKTFLVTGGNLETYIAKTLEAIKYNHGGFYNLTSRLFPKVLIYEYKKQGVRNLTLIGTTYLATSPQISSSNVFTIDYTRFLGNITRSEMSSRSVINFYFYGISVLNSTLKLKWNTGYLQHWITTAQYIVNEGEKLERLTFTVSKIDPLVIVMQRVKPAFTNSSSNLYVSVFSLGSSNATEVKVKLNLPSWLSAENDTLIFKNVSSSTQEKSVKISVMGNLTSGVYEISSPIAYYKKGDTNFTTIGNTILLGYKVKSFASLSFYVTPSSISGPDVLSGPSDFSIRVFNNGNANASNLRLLTDYLDQRLLNLTAGKNDTFPFSINPVFYKEIPKGADVFNGLILSYYNGTQKYEIKIPYSPLFSFSSAFPFINFLSLSARDYSNVFNLTKVNLQWDSIALGLSRSSIILVDSKLLTKQGLVHAGKDSFDERNGIIQAKYSFNRGYSHVISISLNITKNENLVIPVFQISEPLKRSVLMDPIVISSALILTKHLNSTTLKVGGHLLINVTLTNKGSSVIYNVDLRDYLSPGWVLINGNNRTFIETLKPNETITLRYIAKAEFPTSAEIGSAIAFFDFFGKTLTVSSGAITLNILSQVSFYIYGWNFSKLNSGILKIYDTKGLSVANLTIENGSTTWEGYIGRFIVKVVYENNEVLSKEIQITAYNTTFNLRAYVFDLKVKLLDLFGNPISDANVKVYGNVSRSPTLGNGYYEFYNLPKGVYYLIIKVGSYEYKMPLGVDSSTSETITLNLPLIKIFSIVLDVSLVVGIILVLFVILFFYAYIRTKKSQK